MDWGAKTSELTRRVVAAEAELELNRRTRDEANRRLREERDEARAEVERLRKLHEALLNTLAPSKSAWIQHVVRNARAALRGGGE